MILHWTAETNLIWAEAPTGFGFTFNSFLNHCNQHSHSASGKNYAFLKNCTFFERGYFTDLSNQSVPAWWKYVTSLPNAGRLYKWISKVFMMRAHVFLKSVWKVKGRERPWKYLRSHFFVSGVKHIFMWATNWADRDGLFQVDHITLLIISRSCSNGINIEHEQCSQRYAKLLLVMKKIHRAIIVRLSSLKVQVTAA